MIAFNPDWNKPEILSNIILLDFVLTLGVQHLFHGKFASVLLTV